MSRFYRELPKNHPIHVGARAANALRIVFEREIRSLVEQYGLASPTLVDRALGTGAQTTETSLLLDRLVVEIEECVIPLHHPDRVSGIHNREQRARMMKKYPNFLYTFGKYKTFVIAAVRCLSDVRDGDIMLTLQSRVVRDTKKLLRGSMPIPLDSLDKEAVQVGAMRCREAIITLVYFDS